MVWKVSDCLENVLNRLERLSDGLGKVSYGLEMCL